jgi:hypothetical protein
MLFTGASKVVQASQQAVAHHSLLDMLQDVPNTLNIPLDDMVVELRAQHGHPHVHHIIRV